MRIPSGPYFTILFRSIALILAAAWLTAAPAHSAIGGDPQRSAPTLNLPDAHFFPESVTAGKNGALYVSSIPLGAIYRFSPHENTAKSFLPPGSRPGVAGILFDEGRNVLWACVVDLTFAVPSTLEALDPATGAVVASYLMPVGGLCADITLGGSNTVYVTDTIGSQILRLVTPPGQAAGGALTVWANDPILTAKVPEALPLGLNGIAYDPLLHVIFVGKYNSGQLFRVRVQHDGSAAPAAEVAMRRFPSIDGIRLLAPGILLAAVNTGPVVAIAVAGKKGFPKVLGQFDQPSSLTIADDGVWVSEGQVRRLQGIDPSPVHLPFKLRRLTPLDLDDERD